MSSSTRARRSRPRRLPRPHTYTPDVTVQADHRGERPCTQCPMPRTNDKVHRTPLEDDSSRILGES